jgi:asparagine synthase (glutamine-hydrolysing)
MCGIAGIFSNRQSDVLNHEVKNMIQAMTHRGPDDQGTWSTENLVFGHLRLAIQDLSPKGKQPMPSASGRYVISYNGEVYNFIQLKEALSKLGQTFKGGSDTEVILAAIEQWGLDEALKQFEGMFAFSLWDKKEKTLTLCRDRLGEKPLFYGWNGNDFVWASELKAIVALDNWQGTMRNRSVSAYLKYGYVPAPYSIYQDIYKLIPGSYLKLNLEDTKSPTSLNPYAAESANKLQPQYYWNFARVATQEINHKITYSEAIDKLDDLLTQSIQDQMISDVPYGAFLSGGIDSSAVASIMQSLSHNQIKTFTIGFEEKDYNEAPFAKEISNHLGTKHHEMFISSNDCLQLVPQINNLMDEPFADSSILPSYFVSKLARENVTVCLSGDAGDELFCGYNRYTKPEEIFKQVNKLPYAFRQIASKLILLFPPTLIDRIYNMISFIIQTEKNTRVGLKLQKLSHLLLLKDPQQVYDMLISYCQDKDGIVYEKATQHDLLSEHAMESIYHDAPQISQYMAKDTLTYLPDDNLTKVDRSSMAHSLETRLPMLNHKIVEFAWSLPLEMKYKNKQSKRILRDVLYKRIPKELIERPKMGFSVPIANWLRGSLKNYAENHLLGDHSYKHELINQDAVNKLWSEHQSMKRDHSSALWSLLIFKSWCHSHT